jgi:hypothetical protein
MPVTSTTARPPAVNSSRYGLPALSISELRGYRRELERAIAFYARHHPAAPVLADLRDKRGKVQAEEDSRGSAGPAVRF